MYQLKTEPVLARDPMREYQKQKEKLALLEQECIIEWARTSIVGSREKLRKLDGELTGINRCLQALQEEKETIMVDLSQPDAWMKPENQRKTLNLLDTNSKISDAEIAFKQVRENTIEPTAKIEEMEQYKKELEIELEEATQKWYARWPEQDECCMVLKLELMRAQAELNETYQQIERQFARMAPVKADGTLIEIPPCPLFPAQMVAHKDKSLSEKSKTGVVGDLIAFEDEFSNKELAIFFTEVEDGVDSIDLISDCDNVTSTTAAIATQPDHSNILIDLNTEAVDEVLEVARKSDDLAVLITDYPICHGHLNNQELPAQTTVFRDASEIVQVLSKRYGQLIKNRFESTTTELAHKRSEIETLGNKVQLMQPLYDIGLAIRKRRLEVANSRAEKDLLIITQGNDAAHHAQAVADATFMMESPLKQRFQELYNDVPPKVVWEHRECTVFLDMLNWKLNMRLFTPTGGVDKKTFNRLFDYVFPRIYPSLNACDKMVEQNKALSDAFAGMKAEHSSTRERDAQTHRTTRGFFKAQRWIAKQTQTS